MTDRFPLVAVSAGQLAAGIAGLGVAVRRRRHFDIPFLRGDPDHVPRDACWGGTAYSAPVYMLAAQAWAIARLARGPDQKACRVLTWLGGVMIPGYLLERSARQRLRPGGFDPVETPLVTAGLAGAAAMVALGRAGR